MSTVLIEEVAPDVISHLQDVDDDVGLSSEEIDMLGDIMLSEDALMENRETSSSDLPMLEEHNVVLKIQSSPTKGTKVWKEYVRFVFGKKRLSDAKITAIKSLQDSYYRCKILSDGDTSTDNNGGDLFPSVSFWVSLKTVEHRKKEDVWTVDRGHVRYIRVNDKDFIQVVPASDECLRDEVKNNGGRSTLERKVKRKKESSRPAASTVSSLSSVPQMPSVTVVNGKNSTKKFHFSGQERLKERAMEVSEHWVNESEDLAEKVFKKYLVEKLKSDLVQYESLLSQNPLAGAPSSDAYDKHRLRLHDRILVDVVNQLGNGMVEWYDEDYMHRRLKPSLSLGERDGVGNADARCPDQKGGGNIGMAEGDTPIFHSVGTFRSGSGGMLDSQGGGSLYDTGSQLESASTWTYSEHDDATSVTHSTSGESISYPLQGTKPEARFALEAWKQGSSNALLQPSIPTNQDITQDQAVSNEKALDQSSQCLEVSKTPCTVHTELHQDEMLQQASTKSSRAVAYCALGSALGSAIRAKGDYSSALMWFQKALDRQETVFGKGHPFTAKSYYDIGTILHEQGNFEGARDKYRKALAIWKSSIGKEKDKATVYYNIGNVLAAYESIEGK